MEGKYLFTSEAVSPGHPDKICDKIADAILDACLKEDSDARCATECLFIDDLLILGGEISFKKPQISINYEKIARDVVIGLGYDHDAYGLLNGHKMRIENHIRTQSIEIANAVNDDDILKLGAGDQGIMFGYACNESSSYLPLAHLLSLELVKLATEKMKSGEFKHARPDMKSEVSIEYDNGKPIAIRNMVMSVQHDENIDIDTFRNYVLNDIMKVVAKRHHLNEDFTYFINPSNSFVVGGPLGDTGLTGRKIIVDTYGGYAHHGGGSFSGKDPSKVDRTGAYLARYIAKNIVASGIASRAEVQLGYVISQKDALTLTVDTFGTSKYSPSYLSNMAKTIFDTVPGKIIENFKLNKPSFRYQDTSNYSAFYHDDLDLPWEKLDKVEEIKKYIVHNDE